jgi:hypothetical protein
MSIVQHSKRLTRTLNQKLHNHRRERRNIGSERRKKRNSQRRDLERPETTIFFTPFSQLTSPYLY